MRLAPTAAEARDVVERHREPAIGEALERAAQDPLAVALGVAA